MNTRSFQKPGRDVTGSQFRCNIQVSGCLFLFSKKSEKFYIQISIQCVLLISFELVRARSEFFSTIDVGDGRRRDNAHSPKRVRTASLSTWAWEVSKWFRLKRALQAGARRFARPRFARQRNARHAVRSQCNRRSARRCFSKGYPRFPLPAPVPQVGNPDT